MAGAKHITVIIDVVKTANSQESVVAFAGLHYIYDHFYVFGSSQSQTICVV